MHILYPFSVLLSFGFLASGAVIRDLGDDPEAANPKTPPQSLGRPPSLGENIYKRGFPIAPDSCTNLFKPSEQCIRDMQAQPSTAGLHAFSGGELKLDNNHGCSDRQIGQLETAAWDALSLARYTDTEPDSKNPRHVTSWNAWIGPDYPDYSKRIAGMVQNSLQYLEKAYNSLDNFNRVQNFLGKKEFDIYLTCSDPHKNCNFKMDGKGVGGYAWEYHGWLGRVSTSQINSFMNID
jgi:hypothetical protein